MSHHGVGLVTAEEYFYHQSRVDFGADAEPGAELESPTPRRRLLNLLRKTGAVDDCVALAPFALDRVDLERVHTAAYLDAFQQASDDHGGELGDYAGFGAGSYEIAALSAGGVAAAAEAVATGRVARAFALVRPPGHHAEPDRARGYCLLANIPLAIERLRAAGLVRRVAIVDWDVHHGNGAQVIYYDDADTLTISLHQEQLYPLDSGFVTELGNGEGYGTNLNVPLPAGSGAGAYRHAIDEIVLPALNRFVPEMIFVACGYDAGLIDPSGQMAVPARAFGEFTRSMKKAADELAQGRLVIAQEGGYSPLHAPYCGVAVVHELLDRAFDLEDHYDRDSTSPEQPLQPHQRAAVDEARAAGQRSGALTPPATHLPQSTS
jgi:acetoin utilization deacetylase AcuC-like enzyme